MTASARYAPDSRPSVTVIVPVFNDQSGIDACITALEGQTYPRANFEVIVVDNGSDVPIRLRATSGLDSRVITCESPGAYAARNAGIEAAGADILAFTDADCVPDPDWIEKGISALYRGDGRCVVGGEVAMRKPARPTAVELYQALSGFEQRDNIELRGFTVTANLFVARHAMRDIGLFDTRLLSGGDLNWSRRAAAAGYALVYAADAIVETCPRRTIRAAARQARRVAGGRRVLRSDDRHASVGGSIGPRRGALASVLWILRHPELGWWDRLRVFGVAISLYIVRLAESLRLALGRQAERR